MLSVSYTKYIRINYKYIFYNIILIIYIDLSSSIFILHIALRLMHIIIYANIVPIYTYYIYAEKI